ncbi:hypothetical protein QBC39DRAFT_4126 [Podospora conica]|nr:hypothetical protein QBC39DRAFT_4126 [Schizothecium conicum]
MDFGFSGSYVSLSLSFFDSPTDHNFRNPSPPDMSRAPPPRVGCFPSAQIRSQPPDISIGECSLEGSTGMGIFWKAVEACSQLKRQASPEPQQPRALWCSTRSTRGSPQQTEGAPTPTHHGARGLTSAGAVAVTGFEPTLVIPGEGEGAMPHHFFWDWTWWEQAGVFWPYKSPIDSCANAHHPRRLENETAKRQGFGLPNYRPACPWLYLCQSPRALLSIRDPRCSWHKPKLDGYGFLPVGRRKPLIQVLCPSISWPHHTDMEGGHDSFCETPCLSPRSRTTFSGVGKGRGARGKEGRGG